MSYQYFYIIFLLLLTHPGFGISVVNVSSKQAGSAIEVLYDITGSNEDDRFNVNLFCSIDGGKTYSMPLTKVSGDIGFDIEGGFGKKITWNVLDEMNHLIASKVVFKVSLQLIPDGARNMIFVKGGQYMMGRNSGSPDESPAHKVNINDFYIGKYEVTVGDYKTFCKEMNYSMPENSEDWNNQQPVTYVDWFDANAYCQWLGEKTGKKFRLPTEAEWEYAAKGGAKSKNYIFSGSDNINDVGWYKTNSEGVKYSKVGSLSPNELNIFDMSGNVWEWCYDWYNEKYYQQSPVHDPQGPRIGKLKTGRGGSWHDPAVPVTYRFYMSLTAGSSFMGFRVVMEP